MDAAAPAAPTVSLVPSAIAVARDANNFYMTGTIMSYGIFVSCCVFDGAKQVTYDSLTVTIPVGTSAVKADAMIRQQLSDSILARTGLAIAPASIYFPHP